MIVLDTDSNAPWNEHPELTATETKKVLVTLTNVVEVETSEVVEDEDEDGRCVIATKDADWCKAYEEDEFRLPKMLNLLADIAIEKAGIYENEYKKLPYNSRERASSYHKWQYWRNVAEHCKGWKIEDIDIDNP